MSGSARKITQTFNGRTEWLVGGGGYFKLLTTINPVDVELYDRGGVALLAEQVEGGFYLRGRFDRVVITTSALEAVSWMFSPDEGGSDRFTGNVSVLGTVDVSDRAARLLGSLTAWEGSNRIGSPGFMHGTQQAAPGAGNSKDIQLWNPAGSGKTLLVDSFTAAAAGAGYTQLRSAVAAKTLISAGRNKTLAGAAALGELREATIVGGAPNGTELMAFSLVVDVPLRVEFAEPVRVPANNGLHISFSQVNVITRGSFEWREV